MNLNELEILEEDFDVFVALNDRSKIEFLFDALEQGIESSIIKQVAKLDSMRNEIPLKQKINTEDFIYGKHRLCVTLTNDQVYLNSNSLKAIRQFVNKMINDGLLLWPLKTKKTVFDMYKYFKAYKIIGRLGPISSN
tara:strand:- start:48 stop:458 length:411 start_codon:yes stop_codon:yes gene_type:complete